LVFQRNLELTAVRDDTIVISTDGEAGIESMDLPDYARNSPLRFMHWSMSVRSMFEIRYRNNDYRTRVSATKRRGNSEETGLIIPEKGFVVSTDVAERAGLA